MVVETVIVVVKVLDWVLKTDVNVPGREDVKKLVDVEPNEVVMLEVKDPETVVG